MMKNMTLKNIADACHGVYYGPEEKNNICVDGICINSGLVQANWLFVATRGERVDGHSFVGQAFEKGALCVLVEKEPETDGPYILVKDSFQALKDMAAFYRQQLSCKVIGITGSVGKTSTKEMIAGVLSAKYHVQKTEGNFNNEIGVPLTLFTIRDEHEIAVVEMGISDFGEMSRLTAMARPHICVITNIGDCHLENLGTRDGVLRAKTEIFEGLENGGDVILNGQDDKLLTVKEVNGRKPQFFGTQDCYADQIVSKGLLGTICEIHKGDMKITADIRVPGAHQIKNAMAAVCVADLLSLTKEEIEQGISTVEALKGRGKVTKGKTYTVIDESYNANPASMKATLDALAETEGRRVAILGDMYELGANSDLLHKEVGEYAKEKSIDVLICIGENAKHIYDGARNETAESDTKTKKLPATYYFETKEEFLNKKDSVLQAKDNLLIKASHGMQFETLIKELAD